MVVRIMKGLITSVPVALVLGSACSEGPGFGPGATLTSFAAVASGGNVVPPRPPADTSARALASLNATTLAYVYSVAVAPSGTIDSIALYQVPAGEVLPASATMILCAGAAACAITSGLGTVVPPATIATITVSMRSYGTQLVFFTTTAQKAAGGAMRGTIYPVP